MTHSFPLIFVWSWPRPCHHSPWWILRILREFWRRILYRLSWDIFTIYSYLVVHIEQIKWRSNVKFKRWWEDNKIIFQVFSLQLHFYTLYPRLRGRAHLIRKGWMVNVSGYKLRGICWYVINSNNSISRALLPHAPHFLRNLDSNQKCFLHGQHNKIFMFNFRQC